MSHLANFYSSVFPLLQAYVKDRILTLERCPDGMNGLVGMITDRDITLRAVAKGNSPDHCTVREVMSTDVKYVYEDETTQDAADSMSGLQVRRLPVLNRQKRLVGIVSLGDLAVKSNSRAAGALKGISKPNETAS